MLFGSPLLESEMTFQSDRVGSSSGVLTGQDCCKLASDVSLFGGCEGNFEGTVPGTDGGCVDNPFRWCDNLSNNDPEVLTWVSKTFANMVRHMGLRHPGIQLHTERRRSHQEESSSTQGRISEGRGHQLIG
jgi:hypothetical protein